MESGIWKMGNGKWEMHATTRYVQVHHLLAYRVTQKGVIHSWIYALIVRFKHFAIFRPEFLVLQALDAEICH